MQFILRNQQRSQRGAALIIGIVIISLLVLGAVVFAYLTLTQKPGPVLQQDPISIGADDKLSDGRSNNELVIDTKIVEAGIKRDEEQRKAAETVLADDTLPVGDGVTPATTVEAARLSQLQTEFIAETDRRLKLLDDHHPLANKLAVEQKPAILKQLGD